MHAYIHTDIHTCIDAYIHKYIHQGLSQDLETGCPELAVVKFWRNQISKGDHNILRFQP